MYLLGFVWRQLKLVFFGALASVGALFIFFGGYMRKNNQKKVIDITGVELTPGEPDICLGNGEHGYECCCDECDYFLLCLPESDESMDTLNKVIAKKF